MPISSEIIDFDLAIVRAPTLWQSSVMMRRASSAVGAQWTWPPSAVTLRSNSSR